MASSNGPGNEDDSSLPRTTSRMHRPTEGGMQNHGGHHHQSAHNQNEVGISPGLSMMEALLPPGLIECEVLTPTSVSLSWEPPQGTDGQKYSVTWRGERSGDRHCTMMPVTQLEVQNLHPGARYEFSVATISESGEESQSVSVSQCMNIPAPENLTVKKTETSADLSWTAPSSVEHIPHSFLVCYGCKGGKPQFISTASCSAVITGLQPHTEYDVKVRVVCGNGTESEPVSTIIRTGDDLRVKSLTPTSVEVSWSQSKMNPVQPTFQISYICDGTDTKTAVVTDSCSTVIKDLKPDSEYLFNVSTTSESGHETHLGSTNFCTDVPAPGEIEITSAMPTSVSLMWKSLGRQYDYRVTKKCPKYQTTFTVWDSGLIIYHEPEDMLDITVVTLDKNKRNSTASTLQYQGAKVPKPTDVQIDDVRKTVTWRKPEEVDGVSYLLTVTKGGTVIFNVTTDDTHWALPKDALKLGSSYVLFVSTLLGRSQSIPNVVAIDENGRVTSTDKKTYSTQSEATTRSAGIADHKDTPTNKVALSTHSHSPTNTVHADKPRQHGKCQPTTSSNQQPPSTTQHFSSFSAPEVSLSLPGSWSNGLPKLKNKKKYYLRASGKTKSYCSEIQNVWLQVLSEAKSVDSSDMILAICMVVSRVGTDVEATLREIPEGDKPTILVVMHHTFDPDYVVPDSRRYAKGDGMLVVDCLFYEDQGLLRCETNDKAKSAVQQWIERKIVDTQPRGTPHVNESSRFSVGFNDFDGR